LLPPFFILWAREEQNGRSISFLACTIVHLSHILLLKMNIPAVALKNQCHHVTTKPIHHPLPSPGPASPPPHFFSLLTDRNHALGGIRIV
jgi:hypothetical protein